MGWSSGSTGAAHWAPVSGPAGNEANTNHRAAITSSGKIALRSPAVLQSKLYLYHFLENDLTIALSFLLSLLAIMMYVFSSETFYSSVQLEEKLL